ncbi:MAG: hypothetical protein WAQ53_06205 [Thiofilum sp.]|uniref:hypothetical protein n=1 Tax=Thiofilum sp. TaxID=2212733 RepID=UPI0025F1BC1C|nr:hypothetical protein [Thiofilum sp.]MBK8455197.1 hypothetical protein [Thiofilum sp.]
MDFPTNEDFLDIFGLEPIENDPSMGYSRYLKEISNNDIELDISFSAIAQSFQVILRCYTNELVKISSEKVKSIKVRCDKSSSGIYIIFDIQGVTAEAWVKLEPTVSCNWWILDGV